MADPVRDFRLDANGDLAVVNGDFGVIAGEEAVPQGIKTRTRMFLGESFLDETVGVDYLGQILSVKNPDPLVVNELLRAPIAATPDVTLVVDNQFDLNGLNRTLDVAYKVFTIYSTQPLPGSVEVPI